MHPSFCRFGSGGSIDVAYRYPRTDQGEVRGQ